MLKHVHDLIEQGKDWYQVSKHATARIQLLEWVTGVSAKGFITGGRHRLAIDTNDHVCVQGFAAAKEAALKFQRGHIRYGELTITGAKERIRKLESYTSFEDMLKAESDAVNRDHG